MHRYSPVVVYWTQSQKGSVRAFFSSYHLLSSWAFFRWPFRCLQEAGRPTFAADRVLKTALKSFFGQLKTNQQHVIGRKSVNRFVLRYGTYAAFVSLSQTKVDLLARLREVDPVAYQHEHQQFQQILLQKRDYHRFCHHLDLIVQELETEWAAAVVAVAHSVQTETSTIPWFNLP